ncbi:MAG TPA: ferredoxin [bacterium]|nr:ferredoxin [bacterium]
MKVSIDTDVCTGCGLCPSIAPEIFEMAGDTARVKMPGVPSDQEDAAKEAAESCPVEAIMVSD